MNPFPRDGTGILISTKRCPASEEISGLIEFANYRTLNKLLLVPWSHWFMAYIRTLQPVPWFVRVLNHRRFSELVPQVH